MPDTKQHAIIRRAVLSWIARNQQEDLYFYLSQEDPKVLRLIDDIDFDLSIMKEEQK